LGCDYCGTIKGIGPTRALALIKQHGSIETILEKLDREKHPVPEEWPFEEARRLFKEPDVLSADHPLLAEGIKWNNPDEAGVIQFLVTENGFKYCYCSVI